VSAQGCHLGVDVGGTFTDLAFFDAKGVLHTYKIPSTPARPGFSTLQGIDELTRGHRLDGAALKHLHHTHGSTIAINTLIERRGAKLGLITTTGFRDLFELGRLAIPHPMRYDSRRPSPLIPRSRVREVRGRLDAKGRELEPLDEKSVVLAAQQLVAAGAELVVVCLLHSYLSDAHEVRAAEVIAEHFPSLPVELSSRTWPQAREYERAVLATINAFVRPAVEGYLDLLVEGIGARGVDTEPRVIRSNGGMQRATTIRRQPVTALLSGPAAGVAAAAFVAQQAGMPHADLITVDVGGTSVDVGVVRNGKPVLSAEEHVADFPLLTPSIAVSSVGAGGGSIIWLDEAGGLKVGPRSVGADPGPACYGKGAGIAALTDAFLLAGWLADGQKLGGRIPLDAKAARAALQPLGRKLNLSAEEAGDAAISVAIAIMAAETGNVVAKRGIDAPDFSLVAFGGAGPLIGALLAEEAYIDRVLIPPAPGVLSALGAAHANVEGDLIRPVYLRLGEIATERLRTISDQLEGEAAAWLKSEAETVTLGGTEVSFSADMRYEGQGYDVTVALDGAWLREGDKAAMATAFHHAHALAYGHADDSAEVWLKEVRAHVVGLTSKPSYARVAEGRGAKPVGRRGIRIHGGTVEAALYRREQLGAGDRLSGPAIVDQLDTTTLVPPGWDAKLLPAGVLLLTRSAENPV
jgi:N-methylhydantoinase A